MKRGIGLFVFLLTGAILLSGCIRLTGSAGYWHKGKDDEYAKGKRVGFDTQELVDPNYAPGSIQK